jgi:hypothetical protein
VRPSSKHLNITLKYLSPVTTKIGYIATTAVKVIGPMNPYKRHEHFLIPGMVGKDIAKWIAEDKLPNYLDKKRERHIDS